ncbi:MULTISPECIES: serine/threonine-protein kinase [Streptomyces]|uniref:serine/threonine-protein kinase n=1 Tax=Streptomyces TaxID=1883 RepID=UPI00215606F9|nr:MULTISPECIES: serine/threonine protein kinase [Streptomyces]
MAMGGAVRRVIGDRFELLERLGAGGMGFVWRARDTELHREVALKEVRPLDPRIAESGSGEAAVLRERVLREARALARLRHPHVVTIHHIVTGHVTDFPWLVMELVPGGSLADRLEQGLLSPVEAARLGRGLLAGLGAAHAAGILHRDVKPANVLIREDGSPVLTDFGIAALGETSTLTATGALIGSPEYIAPERLRGEEGNPASDLWSLGMLLYVAIEGTHPLRRGTVLATLTAVLEVPVPAPTRAGPLASVLIALLDRDPGARPDAAQLDRLLAEVEAAEKVEAPKDAAPQGPGTTMDAGPEQARVRRSLPRSPGSAPPAPGYFDLPTRSAPAPGSGPGPAPADASPGKVQDAEESSDAGPGPSEADTVLPLRPRRFRPSKRMVRAAVALVLIGAGLAYLPDLLDEVKNRGGSAAGATPQKKESDVHLFTPEGIREVIAALQSEIGSTTVSSMSVSGSHVVVAAQRKDKPEVRHWYTYRDGKVEDDGPAGLTKKPDGIDLREFDWDLLPDLWHTAQTGLGIKNAERDRMGMDLLQPKVGVRLTLWVRDKYGNASMDVNNTGKIISRTPREPMQSGQ